MNKPRDWTRSCRIGLLITAILVGCLFSVLGFLESQEFVREEKTVKNYESELTKVDELMDAQNFDRAILLLNQIVQKTDSNEAKEKLALAYEQQSALLLQKGLTEEAFSVLKQAKAALESLTPGLPVSGQNSGSSERELIHMKKFVSTHGEEAARDVVAEEKARVLFRQAVDEYHNKQYALSRDLLKQGIEFYDKSSVAFELLGDCEYFLQNLGGAEIALGKAYQLESNERVLEKLERVKNEKKLESSSSEYLDEHFIIRYSRREDLEGSEIRQFLRDSYRQISKDFGYYLNYKIVVFLFAKKQYQEMMNIPVWSAGFYDGKIRIPAYEPAISRENLQKLIQHELTHVFVTELSRSKAPIWLQEGLAQYEENKVAPIDLRLFKKAVVSNALLTAEELKKGIDESAHSLAALLFYHQSYMLVSDLVKRYGFVRIKELLIELGKGIEFEEAFRSVYQKSFERFFKEWEKEQKRAASKR